MNGSFSLKEKIALAVGEEGMLVGNGEPSLYILNLEFIEIKL